MTKEELAVCKTFLVADVRIRIHARRQKGFGYKPSRSYPPLLSLIKNEKFKIQYLTRDFLEELIDGVAKILKTLY